MNKNLFRKSSCLLFGLLHFASSLLHSTDFREPINLVNGPMRYFFEESSDKPSLRWWSGAYNRFARRAFNEKTGRNFVEYPALIFGKSDFRTTQIFPDCNVKMNSQDYNPLLRTAKLRLRANYNEVGINLGVCWDYPFYGYTGNPGRFGIRGSVPFKRCKVTKVDTEGVKMGAELQDVLMIRRMRGGDISTGSASAASPAIQDGEVTMVRLDFLEALTQGSGKEPQSYVNYDADDAANSLKRVKVGANYSDASNLANVLAKPAGAGDLTEAEGSQNLVALTYSKEGILPNNENNFARSRVSGTAVSGVTAPNAFKLFPGDGDISGHAGEQYVFKTSDAGASASIYKQLAEVVENKDVASRVKDQDIKATVWAIPFAGFDVLNPTNAHIIEKYKTTLTDPLKTAETISDQVTQNVYEWFSARQEGVDFESFSVEKIGDIRMEVFIQQQVNNKFMVELSGMLVGPSGGKMKYRQNPYQVNAGNGGHWEVAPGAAVALKFNDYANLYLDGKYHFVLSHIEERPACFEKALIKNLGPKVEADVKQQYFVGNASLNLTHPSTAAITGTIGYQFIFRREEDLKYSVDEVETWLGKERQANGTFATAKKKLDPRLAVKNTESISNRLRLEASYILSGCLEFFWGTGWTFIGKNTPATFDAYGGFHVAF